MLDLSGNFTASKRQVVLFLQRRRLTGNRPHENTMQTFRGATEQLPEAASAVEGQQARPRLWKAARRLER